MTAKRKRHSAEFKAKVALEAFKGIKTVNELAADFSVHPGQISQWKKQLTDALPSLFNSTSKRSSSADQKLVDNLYQQIGQLKVELDWLKKKTS
jgi:transposase-like protein